MVFCQFRTYHKESCTHFGSSVTFLISGKGKVVLAAKPGALNPLQQASPNDNILCCVKCDKCKRDREFLTPSLLPYSSDTSLS